MNEQEIHDNDLVGAYVLDALEPAEARAFEAHLRTCSSCRAEVTELGQVVDVLPLALEPVEPSAALRRRIIDAVGDSTRETRPSPPSPAGTDRSGVLLRLRRQSTLMTALAAVLIAGLIVWNVTLQRQVHPQRTAATYYQLVAQARATGATLWPVAGTAHAPAASAVMVQPKGKPAYLILQGLPATPAHKVYQLWLLRSGKPTSARVFRVSGPGSTVVRLPIAAAGYTLTAATIEPGPRGSRGPTGAVILSGKLSA